MEPGKALLRVVAVAGVLTACLATAQQVVIHEPWLNWDFFNLTGQDAYDFDVIVDAPAFAPTETVSPPGWSLTASQVDYGSDGDLDTLLHWSGLNPVAPNSLAHFGLFMAGSGPILDAYWTDAVGAQIGASLPITYELTRVTYPGEPELPWLGMRLDFPEAYYDGLPAGALVGWTGIRTFADIPADLLGLADLNEVLSLNGLLPFETEPRIGDPDGPVILPSEVYWVESFFDVFVDIPQYTSPDYESLLFAQILVDPDGAGPISPVLVGQFWNLNSQSPEPATGLLLACAGLALALRRRPRAWC
jgi:hypothetical protein